MLWISVSGWVKLGQTVETVYVKVYDNVFPLRMEPPDGEFGTQKFNDFIDSLMEPMFNKHPVPESLGVADKSGDNIDDADEDEYIVEGIKKKRVKKGVVQYLVKRVGYNNKHNTWIDIDDMSSSCNDLIDEFDCASALSASVTVDPKDTLQTESQVAEQSGKVFGPTGRRSWKRPFLRCS